MLIQSSMLAVAGSREHDLVLSICIATYNRGKFIGETLDSILAQMQPGVEIIVLDGASPDDTQEVIERYRFKCPQIRYYREPVNSGVDSDYDKAVSYAKGIFCWLMTDDDLLKPGAISRIMDTLAPSIDLLIVNSEVRSADFSKSLEDRFLKFENDRDYYKIDGERFFLEVAHYLTFIGGIIVRRFLWLERDRVSFYGTLFAHVGVIFQCPIPNGVKVIADPLITIRYGNAMWTARGFEIWMFKWPRLIWSFPNLSEDSKAAVSPKEPWRIIKNLLLYRAIGSYGLDEYRQFIERRNNSSSLWPYKIIALFPATAINLITCLYCVLINRNARTRLYDISRSRYAFWASRLLGKYFL
jgi:glycosyltransferase involved in cell wall biosynthesis